MTTAIITGASSGLGRCIYERWTRELGPAIDWSLTTGVDVRDALSIRNIGLQMLNYAGAQQPIDVLINCAGVNHIDFLPELEEKDWDRVMDTNAKSIYLTTKVLLPYLQGKPNNALMRREEGGTILNIVSNASHLPMTSSLAYNASKAAASIMTQQMARELGKTHNITVFGISPNKLKNTGMTSYIDRRVCELRGWTMEEAQKYQLASLPAGAETDPEVLAEFICFLLSSKERHQYLQGCILPYGGPS